MGHIIVQLYIIYIDFIIELIVAPIDRASLKSSRYVTVMDVIANQDKIS